MLEDLRRIGRHPFLAWLATCRRQKILVGLLALSLGGWAFAELADEVLEGDTHALDEALLLAMRTPGDLSDPLGPGWLEEIGRDFTALGGVGVLTLVTLSVAGFLALAGKGRSAVFLLLAVGGGLLVSTLAKQGFDRPRPDLVPHESIVYTASFPSGHSMLSAVVYLTLGVMLARAQPRRGVKAYLMSVAVLLALAVGVSRVYLGVHWPTDVLAGWTAGAAWALACWLAATWLAARRAIEPEEGTPEPPMARGDGVTADREGA